MFSAILVERDFQTIQTEVQEQTSHVENSGDYSCRHLIKCEQGLGFCPIRHIPSKYESIVSRVLRTNHQYQSTAKESTCPSCNLLQSPLLWKMPIFLIVCQLYSNVCAILVFSPDGHHIYVASFWTRNTLFCSESHHTHHFFCIFMMCTVTHGLFCCCQHLSHLRSPAHVLLLTRISRTC